MRYHALHLSFQIQKPPMHDVVPMACLRVVVLWCCGVCCVPCAACVRACVRAHRPSEANGCLLKAPPQHVCHCFLLLSLLLHNIISYLSLHINIHQHNYAKSTTTPNMHVHTLVHSTQHTCSTHATYTAHTQHHAGTHNTRSKRSKRSTHDSHSYNPLTLIFLINITNVLGVVVKKFVFANAAWALRSSGRVLCSSLSCFWLLVCGLNLTGMVGR